MYPWLRNRNIEIQDLYIGPLSEIGLALEPTGANLRASGVFRHAKLGYVEKTLLYFLSLIKTMHIIVNSCIAKFHCIYK